MTLTRLSSMRWWRISHDRAGPRSAFPLIIDDRTVQNAGPTTAWCNSTGANGYSREYAVERIDEGTHEIQRLVIAREMLRGR